MIPLAQPLVNTKGSTDTPQIVGPNWGPVLRFEYPYSDAEMSRYADGPETAGTEE
ncbi:hypothetical protein Sliba_57040 [Streptomyces nigrescens]|uniref:Uncharacterized protein n=1 Tax=Streptomyces nigrescens TaxID=1920 RepID=A0A640TSP9_STRNI|nr:hypothetical protein Sliba_57040 [Streptomyces libani subsp. libani]GGW06141.1 hypothetical protein GCM10010500_71990 [Streptomyces libani subsp. libani]